MINCGGIVDLLALLQEALDDEGGASRRAEDLPHPDCRWYIIDSHRPYSLENLTDEDDKARIYPTMGMQALLKCTLSSFCV